MRATATAVLLLTLVGPSRLSAQEPSKDLPRFTSSVEVTTLDVSVFDGQGRPVTDLKADDFIVHVDKAARQVTTADWVTLETSERRVPIAVPADYSSNENSSGGRLIMIVVDQPNIRVGGTLGIRKAVNGFIERLRPSDRAAVIGIGLGAPSTSFTADRGRLKKAIERLVGQHSPSAVTLHNIGVSEALDIDRGLEMTLAQVVKRECSDMVGAPDLREIEACMFEIRQEAREIARSGAQDGRDTVRILRGLLGSLRLVEGPKTMIFVSEGFLIEDMEREVAALGTMAAAARTSIYALRLDDTLFQTMALEARLPMSRMDDRAVRGRGMEILTGASRGSLINVIGDGVNAIKRIESELTGYYLLGVESGAADKDGKPHAVAVEVKRRGVSVRTRRTIIVAADAAAAKRSPPETVMAALASPLPVAALPIRVATYSLQGPEPGRVQLLIHADIGTDYPASRVVSLGYLITDAEGRMVDSQASTGRLAPVMTGVPSALQFSGGASLPPGDYLLKIAVAEGDRLGTVEHTIHAGTTAAGDLRVSDLMVGGPVAAGSVLLQPSVGHTVVFGLVHGYVEAYGAASSATSARYDIVSTPDGEALVSEDVPASAAGATRAIFTRMLPVRQLPPGGYFLRVTLSSGGARVKTLTRAFEVAAPAVLMTSATSTPETTVREIYLPVHETAFGGRFDAAGALKAETVSAFRQRVAEAHQAAFDQGVEAFSTGAYGDAEAHFKRAVTPEADSSAALAYLAATYAAAGHDHEAANAWQTALVDGSDLPEIYEWLAGALMRQRDLALARSVLEEALAKWPSDLRFVKPIAVVYATFGQGPQAVRSLERHLERHPEDVEALAMQVEWIYQLRSAGAVAHSPAEDLTLARRYSSAYVDSKGPQLPLVRQWMEFLERRNP